KASSYLSPLVIITVTGFLKPSFAIDKLVSYLSLPESLAGVNLGNICSGTEPIPPIIITRFTKLFSIKAADSFDRDLESVSNKGILKLAKYPDADKLSGQLNPFAIAKYLLSEIPYISFVIPAILAAVSNLFVPDILCVFTFPIEFILSSTFLDIEFSPPKIYIYFASKDFILFSITLGSVSLLVNNTGAFNRDAKTPPAKPSSSFSPLTRTTN